MTRSPRLAAATVLTAALLTLSACGGGSSNDDAYKKDAAAAVQAVSATGDKLGSVVNAASTQSDAALTNQFTALKKQADDALAKVKALNPPTDSAKKLVAALESSFAVADRLIGQIEDAASVSDPTKAQAATEDLAKASPAVQSANRALGASVGVTSTTTTSTAP